MHPHPTGGPDPSVLPSSAELEMPRKKQKIECGPPNPPTDGSCKNHDTIVQMMCKRLMRQRVNAAVVKVDFDIMAVFLMQEFPNLDIDTIVTHVRKAFSRAAPQTMLQNQIRDSANEVEKTILDYKAANVTTDIPKKPFCLRYPNLSCVLQLAKELEQKCTPLDGTRMVILLDESDRCCGVGIPPVEKKPNNVHPTFEDVAVKSLENLVSKLSFSPRTKEMVISDDPVLSPPKTPYPLDDMSEVTEVPLAIKEEIVASLVSFQKYGYAPESEESHRFLDLKLPHTTEQIKMEEMQGINLCWKEEQPPVLPYSHGMSPPNSILNPSELLGSGLDYYLLLSYWINKSFLPQAASIAEKSFEYLIKHGSNWIQKDLEKELNPILASRAISFNSQFQTHRDPENGFLFDAVVSIGNHCGGDLILPALGVAYPGGSGYSFHGPLRILWHGLGQIYFSKDTKNPLHFFVALSSQASSFSGVARVAAFEHGNQEFQDPSYWLPIYPKYVGEETEKIWALQQAIMRKNKRSGKK